MKNQDFKMLKYVIYALKSIQKKMFLLRDHYHVTGKYRGSAHNTCNRSFRLSNKIPIIFHNSRGYDGHLIMQEIGQFNKTINVIPNNMERYMSFMISDLVFILLSIYEQ